jgi:ribosomal protein S6
MPLYEHVFLARQDLAQAQVDALAENATKIIEDNGGKVVKTETWGLRSLAYRIAKNRKAHYVMLDLDAPAAAVDPKIALCIVLNFYIVLKSPAVEDQKFRWASPFPLRKPPS